MAKFFSKLKSALPFFILLYLLPMILLVGVVIAHKITGIPLYKYTWDPAMFKGIRPSFGIVSIVGNLIWCGAAVVAIFTWAVLRGCVSSLGRVNFFLYAGLLTLVLMADDLFMIHEKFGARGIPETIIYGIYLLFLILLFFVYRKFIFQSPYLVLLLVAGGLLGLSLGVDIYQEPLEAYIGDWTIFTEDSFKFLGIVGWFGYFLRTGYAEIVGLLKDGSTPPAP